MHLLCLTVHTYNLESLLNSLQKSNWNVSEQQETMAYEGEKAPF